MQVEEAWDLYRAKSDEEKKSASVSGQLDTLSAQMQEVRTGMDRLTKLIPRLMGDESAINDANAKSEASLDPLGEIFGGPGDEAPVEDVDYEPYGENAVEEDEDDDYDDEDYAPFLDVADADVVDEEDEPEDGPETEIDETPFDETAEADTAEPSMEDDEDDEDDEEYDPYDDEEYEPYDDEGMSPEGYGSSPDDGGMDVDMDITAEEPATELPPEGASLQNLYSQILSLILQAYSVASKSGDYEALGGIAKSSDAMTKAYRDMCPYLDTVLGTDWFTKSFADLEKCGNGTGVVHTDDMVQKSEDGSKDTKMHDVEDEKGPECEKQDGPKLGLSDMSKSQHLVSFKDKKAKECIDPTAKSEESGITIELIDSDSERILRIRIS